MKKYLPYLPLLIVIAILGMTLPFKFSGAEESKHLFTQITQNIPVTPSNEATMRIGTGILETIAILLLLIPATRAWGAATALGTMAGAILTHVYLGIFDELLIMAIVTALSSAILVWIYRKQLPILNKF